MALGASRLTGDTTRFKAFYTTNLPLLPPPVAPPRSTSPFLSRLLRFAMSTDIEEGHDYAEDCYAYNGPPCLPLPPPVVPPLSLALRSLCLHRGSLCLHRGSLCLHRGSLCLHRGSLCLHRGSLCLHQGLLKPSFASDNGHPITIFYVAGPVFSTPHIRFAIVA